jgi:acyl carrier protein
MTPIELIRSAVFSFWRMINVANLENLEEKVINIVSEQLNVAKDEITLSSNYLDDLKADSLDLVELVMEFEDEFGITVPDEDYEKIRTVGDSIAYIKEKAGE